MKRSESTKCCKTCPFLAINAGKPNPNGWQPEDDQHDWYSDKNLKRLWEGIRRGEVMICHSSDPNADSYGGNASKPGSERPCTGAVLLTMLHMNRYGELLDKSKSTAYREYQKLTGKPITKRGMEAHLMMNMLGRTGLFGGAPIPQSISEDREFRVVWRDEIIEKFNNP